MLAPGLLSCQVLQNIPLKQLGGVTAQSSQQNAAQGW